MWLSTSNARTQSLASQPSVQPANKAPLASSSRPGVPLFLQRADTHKVAPGVTQRDSGLATAIRQSSRGGAILPRGSRSRFESAFGCDLSAVRVHDDSQHHALAEHLNARAFTVGSNIFFGRGHFRPGSFEGDRLLAHEVTHVLQQCTTGVQAKQLAPGVRMGERGGSHEAEADRVADGILAAGLSPQIDFQQGIYGKTPVKSTTADCIIQRDEDEEQGLNYELLPPALSYRRGPFGASADTSAAQLSYFSDEGRTSLGYQYGGDLFYQANLDGFRSRFGVNPSSGVGSMSIGGSQGGFNFGVGGNTAGNFNLGLGYGAPLLPMPSMLSQQAGAAWQGATAVGGALPNAMSDPIGAYQANSEHINAMGAFGSSLGKIYGQQGGGALPFGAGLTLSYNPEQRWVFGAGLQGSF